MDKIKLNLDDLKVESFATGPSPSPADGTIFGQATVFGATCVWDTCNTYYQCNTYTFGCHQATSVTCAWEDTCDYTCNCGTPVHCTTDEFTDCPLCPGYTEPDTWCTDYGCTGCGAIC